MTEKQGKIKGKEGKDINRGKLRRISAKTGERKDKVLKKAGRKINIKF